MGKREWASGEMPPSRMGRCEATWSDAGWVGVFYNAAGQRVGELALPEFDTKRPPMHMALGDIVFQFVVVR